MPPAAPPLKPATPQVVITGVGAWTPFGKGSDALWSGMVAGSDGHRPAGTLMPGLPDGMLLAALPADDRAYLQRGFPDVDPTASVALEAAREAIEHSGLPPGDRGRWVLVLGNGNGTLISPEPRGDEDRDDTERRRRLRKASVAELTATVARDLGIEGPRLTVSTACASSTHAIGVARELLLAGLADVAVAGGADLMHVDVVRGFWHIGAMSPGACAPFSHPQGMTMGEGAGFVVLERWDDASARSSEPMAWLQGLGMACDPYHPTASDPSGAGMARSILAAMHDAGVGPEQIGCYNAHGTGTASNDIAETMALRTAFPSGIPVTACKAQLGHAQGAAGVLETIVASIALQRQLVPAIPSFTRPRNLAPGDVVTGPGPREVAHDRTLKHSAAFGGSNVSLVLGRRAGVRRREVPREVYVTGLGSLGPYGFDVRSLSREIERQVPRGKEKNLDTASQLLAAAIAGATEGEAGSTKVSSLGLFVGVSGHPNRSEQRYRRDQGASSRQRTSARAFSRAVRNAPAGAVARQFELHGPDCTLASGHGAGLLALALAVTILRRREDLAGMLASGLDLPGRALCDHHALHGGDGPRPSAGAACLLIEPPGGQPLARVAGVGLAGPSGLASAIARALGGARPDFVLSGSDGSALARRTERAALHSVLGPRAAQNESRSIARQIGYCEASAALFAATAAAEAIRAQDAKKVLVVSTCPVAGTAALLMAAP